MWYDFFRFTPPHTLEIPAMIEATIHEGAAAAARVRILDLDLEMLRDAVHASEIERRSCSLLEPSTSPGFKAWAAAFRTLAERLVPLGWARSETRSLPRLVNRETALAITVCNGDEGTGIASRCPKTKNPRGGQSVLLVHSNARQLKLPFPGSEFTPVPRDEEQITWWLLIHSSDGGDLRAELALPVALGDDRRFAVWEERILFDVGAPGPDLQDEKDDEDPLEIDVQVRPRD